MRQRWIKRAESQRHVLHKKSTAVLNLLLMCFSFFLLECDTRQRLESSEKKKKHNFVIDLPSWKNDLSEVTFFKCKKKQVFLR